MSEHNLNNNLSPVLDGSAIDQEVRRMRMSTTASDWVEAAREEETTGSKVARVLDSAVSKLTDWLRPTPPGELPVPTQLASALTDRISFHDWLAYREFDDERKLVYMTAADTFRVGFVLGFAPLLVAGTDIEPQLEAVLTNCPPDTVVQVGVLSGSQTQHILDAWTRARTENNPHPMLQEVALRRAEFFQQASESGGTLTFGGTTFQPRNVFYYLSVSLPYNGAPDDENGMDIFLKNIIGLRATIEGGLKGASIPSWVLNREGFEFLVNEIVNPQLTPQERRERLGSNMPMPASLVDRQSRITVKADGTIGFMNGADPDPDKEILASVLTMDSPPVEGWLPNTAKLLGHPLSRDDRINCPFWMHTTILVQHPDKAKDRITMKLGSLNKQMMSDSPWYRSMMGHLYTQKDELDTLLESSRHGHAPVRVWSGVVLYNTRDRVKRETEYVANIWRKAGFRCSPERYISLPVFLASLPLMYDPAMDPPSRGLQRANTVNSFNAATLMHVQGDWAGSAPNRGGPLMVSRRGQLATIDLFDTSSNYNFVVIAQSGSGKSFFSNELAVDFLSRNGVVRIFDVGRSYKRFASVMGGVILEFTPDNPVSLNPFSGIATHGDLWELMPMLKSLIRQMAFPLSTDESMETQFNWEYQAIEQAITSAWEINQEATGLEHVYYWMAEQEDQRYKDLAFQLHSFAVGRYAAWFNGPRQIELTNDLIIVELEDLEVDPDLQAVVMTLMIHQIAKEMYLSDPERKRPKLLLVDEGWRLLGDKQSGGFISKAFRTVRKYRGAAGAITQSYGDFANSAAARAALENSAWQFVLKQKGDSIDFAVSQKWIADDELLTGMLKTVNSDTNAGFSEIFVRGEHGQGIYRFITDKHSYWLYTTNPRDLAKLAEVQQQGLTLLEAVDYLAREDYLQRGHPCKPKAGSLREAVLREQRNAEHAYA
ncbi:conjugal transfer ATP-binding protein TraC [Novimethylophilus kurashikiensis]|uniref:Conjugal transfer ATP-binding protein TraC n=1 Tax=Novimethylophilus kurashikiensis TaxID=1825523 RepID=A0A2R5FBX3_9PROT|nr:TraC family protein [Novimethylophilus kurashikiensis]GBG14413.1 conjugal transfer ATP-binding protein TraC [Novimethylophilus kurashikiensis]